MSEVTLSSEQFKEIVKNAILELMRDNREELSDFFAEIIEDIAMEKAIDEGTKTDWVSRESIFQILEQKE